MGRLTRCKKCKRFFSSIHDMSKYGDHGWKFSCCKTDYYKCNRETCSHAAQGKKTFYYCNLRHLNQHIQKFHVKEKEDEDIPINLEDYFKTKIVPTSYQESSSLHNYFTENHCMESNSFPYQHQRDAIKKMITTACSKKGGVMSLSRTISDASFHIFFALARIAFLANDVVIKYVSIILSLMPSSPYWNDK